MGIIICNLSQPLSSGSAPHFPPPPHIPKGVFLLLFLHWPHFTKRNFKKKTAYLFKSDLFPGSMRFHEISRALSSGHMNCLEKINCIGWGRKDQIWIRFMGLRHLLFLRNNLRKKAVRFRYLVKVIVFAGKNACVFPHLYLPEYSSYDCCNTNCAKLSNIKQQPFNYDYGSCGSGI